MEKEERGGRREKGERCVLSWMSSMNELKCTLFFLATAVLL